MTFRASGTATWFFSFSFLFLPLLRSYVFVHLQVRFASPPAEAVLQKAKKMVLCLIPTPIPFFPFSSHISLPVWVGEICISEAPTEGAETVS